MSYMCTWKLFPLDQEWPEMEIVSAERRVLSPLFTIRRRLCYLFRRECIRPTDLGRRLML